MKKYVIYRVYLVLSLYAITIQAQTSNSFDFLKSVDTYHNTKDTISFLHITDLHLMFNLESYDKNVVDHRENVRKYKKSNVNFMSFINEIPYQTNSDFVVATGDLVDFYDAKTPQGHVLKYQIEQMAEFMKQSYFPIYFTLGNHDTFSYEWGDNKVIPNQIYSGEAKATWIRNFDCFRNGTYYSKMLRVGDKQFKLLFLDDNFYQLDKEDNVTSPYIDKSQLKWLKNEISASDDDIEILFMHIPFNKNISYNEGNNELYRLLSKSPSVRLILSGHHHRNEISAPISQNNRLSQVQTGALVLNKNNWRVIYLTENSIIISVAGSTQGEIKIDL